MLNSIKWYRRGLFLYPDTELDWQKSHCMIPTLLSLGNDIYRIYYSTRDSNNRSHVTYSEVDFSNEPRIIYKSDQFVLAPGELGTFDDNGVTPSCVIKAGEVLLMYYIGWNPGSTVRMHLFGGLAVSEDNGQTFTRWSKAPIIGRNKVNPYLNTAPFVISENNCWTMYYVSGTEWVHKDLPKYNIQLATSSNGYNWDREGTVCIDFVGNETALARPFVYTDNGTYKMYFSSKIGNYQLMYAESNDGIKWQRRNPLSFINSCEYDSNMQEYAVRINTRSSSYILYNGNNYGYDGILLAEANS